MRHYDTIGTCSLMLNGLEMKYFYISELNFSEKNGISSFIWNIRISHMMEIVLFFYLALQMRALCVQLCARLDRISALSLSNPPCPMQSPIASVLLTYSRGCECGFNGPFSKHGSWSHRCSWNIEAIISQSIFRGYFWKFCPWVLRFI